MSVSSAVSTGPEGVDKRLPGIENPAQSAAMSTQDARHGTNRGYIVGCRDECCTAAHRVYMKLYRMGRQPKLTDATGTVRRVHALLALGWTCADIGNHCGRGAEWARMVSRSATVSSDTVAVVRAAYAAMSMMVPTGWRHERTRRHYASKGYAPPLAWDDDTLDDPEATPAGVGFHAADRGHALTELDEQGVGITAACRRLEVSRIALQKWCERNGMSDLYRSLAAREDLRYWTKDGVA